jgi:hypothetical protein
MVAVAAVAAKPKGLGPLLLMAIQKAAKSGSAGFVAGTVQVVAFMWLRTVMNYQYKKGGAFFEVLAKLYKEGGIARLYQGMFPWAIFQAPLSRFGDVFSNEVMLAITGSLFPDLSVSVTTVAGSVTSAAFRVVITPIDTCKTVLQTDGKDGMKVLTAKVSKEGILCLWRGWEGNYVANIIGNYPWFATMNLMQKNVPIPKGEFAKLVRSAFCGAVASSVSDVVSNGVRVVKTKKQGYLADADPQKANMGYLSAAKEIIEKDGVYGVLFRGLETRIFTNVLQGAFFTVLWKYLAGGR